MMTTSDTVSSTIPRLTQEERLTSAGALVRRNCLWAAGAGVSPLPLLDLVAASAVQIKLIKELSNLYGVTFREEWTKKLLASLATGVVGIGLGATLALSATKFIPGIGTALGVVALPITLGALTYATGKVFIMHFETGGTLLDFDPAAMRAYFKAEFDAGRDVVTRMYTDERTREP